MMKQLLIRVMIDENDNIVDSVIKKGLKGKVFEMAGIYAYLMNKELNKIKLKGRKIR